MNIRQELNKKNEGFTLIELLIVVAIIAILAVILFVALDPLSRLADSRDSKRAAQASEVLSALKVDQVDNGGYYNSAVNGATAGEVYLIGSCASGATATTVTDFCDTNPTQAVCLDLTTGGDDIITQGYIGDIPISPDGLGTWTAATTGYTIQKETTGILRIRSCESENTSEIVSSR
ncbi:MAG: type II secretion system protein [bacterium]|nr:type II secretion system protein [bacterium]